MRPSVPAAIIAFAASRAEEHPRQIDVDHALPIGQAQRFRRPRDGDAGIVDQDVEPAELGHRLPHHLDHRRLVRHVGGDGHTVRADRPQAGGGRLHALQAPPGTDHARPCFRQRLGKHHAETRARAGHDGHAARQVEQLLHCRHR
jgi:hypothetical protein